MLKIKSWVITILFILSILLIGYVVSAQQVSLMKVASKVKATVQSKHVLARAVLTETGIAKQYNLLLGNGLEMAFNQEKLGNAKLVAWMESLLAQEAGWKHVEAKYTAQLEANFSEAELRKILNLAKQPLMKNLLQAEIEAYTNSAGERHRLISKFWDNYVAGLFIPPSDVLP